MPACNLTPGFVKAAQRIHFMDEESIRVIVDAFLGGVSMTTLSAKTGVPNEALNRLFTLPWRESLTSSGLPKSYEIVPAVVSALDPTTLQAIAELVKCGVAKDTIHDYLKLKPSVFEAHWRAVLESRRRKRAPQTQSAAGP